MHVILFVPQVQERVWGGRNLETFLGRELPADRPIGESWEVVDREEACSVIQSGSETVDIRALIETDPEAILGPGWKAERRFPILVKWLDCADRLSLQVHPPAQVAPELGGEPKTENWYIARTEGDAAVLVGIDEGMDADRFRQAIDEGTVETVVPRLSVKPGDSIFVPSGRLHAIDGGNVILEIQQNSDTTYRVYDWGRVGLDGQPRQLHIEESLRSIDYADTAASPIAAQDGDHLLVDAPEFRLRKVSGDRNRLIAFDQADLPALVHNVGGDWQIQGSAGTTPLAFGQTALLPYGGNHYDLQPLTETAELLITDRFTRG